MSVEEVRKYIAHRLMEAQQWAVMGFSGSISGVNLRKYPCVVRPLTYINESNKEGKGVRFRIIWKGEAEYEVYSDLDIRIVPEGFCGERSEYPYATIYAVNPEARSKCFQKDNCEVIQFEEYALGDFNLGPTVSIQQFFTNLLKMACRHERCASVLFRYKIPISNGI